MIIRKLKIENVRGIESREFQMNLHPNTPSFFVAPNGFGKTSIATAFNSLNRNRIELEEEDYYKNDMTAPPLISLTDAVGNTYSATDSSNTISDNFSIFVIKSQVKPKASTRNFGGFSSSTPSLVVEPIVLYKSIPERKELSYSFSEMKSTMGTSVGKILINLNSVVRDSSFVRNLCRVRSEFSKVLQVRNYAKVDAALQSINGISGTATQIANANIDVSTFNAIDAIMKIGNTFSNLFAHLTCIERVANIIQICLLYRTNQTQLSKIERYYVYLADKNEINEMLGFFNCTWKNIKASKKDNQFIIEFPKANQISNGERDILCFIGKLFEAHNVLRKEKSVLVIDEIFDYLDDANLIAAQYFLTKMINQYKTEGKEFFPIILTHLDPMYFNTYSFSTKNIVYLQQITGISNKYKINNLLKDREACKRRDFELYNRISSNYLHYSTDNTDDSAYLSSIGVEMPLRTPQSFRLMAAEELENYKQKRTYDLALVCCGLRLQIEKAAYDQLLPEWQSKFLTTFKTVDKLAYSKEKGAIIPEVHFLLAIIYNEAMHLDSQCQKLNPIACKLNNRVIQNMISEL